MISCCKDLLANCSNVQDKGNCSYRFCLLLTASLDIESIFYLLMEVLKKQGMTDEVKNTCLEICDLLISSSLLNSLKAKLFFSFACFRL